MNWIIQKLLNRHSPQISVALLVLFLTGCSSWPWNPTNREAERLTRVIHTENARLKDLVVQFRSSNEDMAQRALDDSRRLEKLAEENDALRTSVAAYQAERERMARAFQNLQQQVQVVLSERGTLSAMNPATPPAIQANNLSRPLPPEGRLLADGNEFQIDLADWFLPGTAIIKPGQEARLKTVSAWLEPQLTQIKEVSYVSSKPKRDPLARVSTELLAGPVKSENFDDLSKFRAERFWEALIPLLPADKASSLRLTEDLQSRPKDGQQPLEGTIRFRFLY